MGNRRTVDEQGSDQSDSGGDDRAALQEHRRVIGKSEDFGIQISPAGEETLFRTGETDLLDAADHRKAHAAFPGAQLHPFPGDLKLCKCGQDIDDDARKNDECRRNQKRRGVMENLCDIDQREQGIQDRAVCT